MDEVFNPNPKANEQKGKGKAIDIIMFFILTCGVKRRELKEACFSRRESELGFEVLTLVLSSHLVSTFSILEEESEAYSSKGESAGLEPYSSRKTSRTAARVRPYHHFQLYDLS